MIRRSYESPPLTDPDGDGTVKEQTRIHLSPIISLW